MIRFLHHLGDIVKLSESGSVIPELLFIRICKVPVLCCSTRSVGILPKLEIRVAKTNFGDQF
jgi:hypothetical protein